MCDVISMLANMRAEQMKRCDECKVLDETVVTYLSGAGEGIEVGVYCPCCAEEALGYSV